MRLIETITVGAGGSNGIEFNNIPQTYTDLFIVHSLRSTFAATQSLNFIRVNYNASSIYQNRRIEGTGSTTASWSQTNDTFTVVGVNPGANATANTFGNGHIYIPNYASANYKTWSAEGVNENNGTAAYQIVASCAWHNTAAITQITLADVNSPLVQYSTASLYGITRGSGGATVA